MKTIIRMLAVVSAVSALTAWAQDDEDSDEGSDESAEVSSAEASGGTSAVEAEESDGEESEEGAGKAKSKDKYFHILPYCRLLEGKAEVLRPGQTTWEPIVEGRFYALGTSYRSVGAGSRLVIKFGKEVDAEIKGDSSFGTRAQSLEEPSRTLLLKSGSVKVKLPRNLPDGLFVVTAPGFKVVNPKGDSRYTYSPADGDGDMAVVRCITGDLTVEGRHFKVLTMKAANEIKIRTTNDQLFTGLYGSRGDYIVRLDQGRRIVKDYGTGESHQEEKTLDWKLSPQTAVRIHRALPALGDKMAVTIMTFDASGELKNRCAFAENTVEVNSGELGPTSKKDREAIAKKAAEATDTVAAETVTTEAAEEDSEASEDKGSSSDNDDELEF